MPKLKQTIGLKELKKPTWLKFTEDEVKAIVQKLAKKGLTSEKIGLILKNQYGIPKVKLYGLKIKKIMDSFKEPTLINLEKKIQKLEEHYKKNKHDRKSERALTITKAKIRKRLEYEGHE